MDADGVVSAYGSDDDLGSLHSSDFDDFEEDEEGFDASQRQCGANPSSSTPSAFVRCAPAIGSTSASRTATVPKAVSPHVHRGAHRPRGLRCLKDSLKWVKEGVKEDLVNQEFDPQSLHHPEVLSEWTSFIQSAASGSKEKQSAIELRTYLLNPEFLRA